MEQFSTVEFCQFMDALDAQSRKIIWYFRYHRHVRIAELTELIGASSDMEALYRLKEVINPVATRFFGKPLLEFCESRIDQNTGKSVLFHWWLMDFLEEGEPVIGEREKPLVDIFDEENQLVIISEVSPLMKLSDKVKVEQRHGILSITIDKIQ
ncbi:MAG: hypothetical protein PHG19_12230 [Anaerotignum sp.]|nr:hypothetical protein [Anaerotignum sp.]